MFSRRRSINSNYNESIPNSNSTRSNSTRSNSILNMNQSSENHFENKKSIFEKIRSKFTNHVSRCTTEIFKNRQILQLLENYSNHSIALYEQLENNQTLHNQMEQNIDQINTLILEHLSINSSNISQLKTLSKNRNEIIRVNTKKQRRITNTNVSTKNMLPYNIYLEFFIMNQLYHSTKNKGATFKPYCLYKLNNQGNVLRSYVRNIPNSITFEEYLNHLFPTPSMYSTSANLSQEDIEKNIDELLKMLIKICDLLYKYQEEFNFIHNNLNLSNIIIYKNKPYIINFQYSAIECMIHNKPYYLCNEYSSIKYSRISDENNIMARSTDMLQLMLRLIISFENKNMFTLYSNFNFLKFIFNYHIPSGGLPLSFTRNKNKYINLYDDILDYITTQNKRFGNKRGVRQQIKDFNYHIRDTIYEVTQDYDILCNIIFSKKSNLKNTTTFSNDILPDTIQLFQPQNMKEICKYILQRNKA
jgi:hypothetical protein